MFDDLNDFSMQRTGKQAFGFYITYFILLIIVFFVLGYVAALTLGVVEDDMFKIGAVGAVIICPLLTYQVVAAKKLQGMQPYFLIVLSALVAILGGGLLGLIPTAYLTTRENLNVNNEI